MQYFQKSRSQVPILRTIFLFFLQHLLYQNEGLNQEEVTGSLKTHTHTLQQQQQTENRQGGKFQNDKYTAIGGQLDQMGAVRMRFQEVWCRNE